jgi:hypothetical protein
MFLGSRVCGWCVGLTTLPPSVSRLSRQCGILNISQPHRSPRPVTGIALLTFTIQYYLNLNATMIVFLFVNVTYYICLLINTTTIFFHINDCNYRKFYVENC